MSRFSETFCIIISALFEKDVFFKVRFYVSALIRYVYGDKWAVKFSARI